MVGPPPPPPPSPGGPLGTPHPLLSVTLSEKWQVFCLFKTLVCSPHFFYCGPHTGRNALNRVECREWLRVETLWVASSLSGITWVQRIFGFPTIPQGVEKHCHFWINNFSSKSFSGPNFSTTLKFYYEISQSHFISEKFTIFNHQSSLLTIKCYNNFISRPKTLLFSPFFWQNPQKITWTLSIQGP